MNLQNIVDDTSERICKGFLYAKYNEKYNLKIVITVEFRQNSKYVCKKKFGYICKNVSRRNDLKKIVNKCFDRLIYNITYRFVNDAFLSNSSVFITNVHFVVS